MITYHHTRFLEEWNTRIASYLLPVAEAGGVIALPGGSTPQPFLQYAWKHAAQVMRTAEFLATDERMVPLDHDASNTRMLRSFLPEATVHAYDDHLTKRLPHHGLDLCVLGVGEDGHIASLFPGKHHLALTKTIRTQKPGEEYLRRSLSLHYILKSKQILLIARGQSKQPVMMDLLFGRTPSKALPVRALLKHPNCIVVYHN